MGQCIYTVYLARTGDSGGPAYKLRIILTITFSPLDFRTVHLYFLLHQDWRSCCCCSPALFRLLPLVPCILGQCICTVYFTRTGGPAAAAAAAVSCAVPNFQLLPLVPCILGQCICTVYFTRTGGPAAAAAVLLRCFNCGLDITGKVGFNSKQ